MRLCESYAKKLMRIGVGCSVLAAGSVTAKPAAAATVIGAGVESCGTWNQDRANEFPYVANIDRQWIVGYLSGAAIWSGNDLLAQLDYGAVVSWIDNYCAAHPLAHVYDAADALALRLKNGTAQ